MATIDTEKLSSKLRSKGVDLINKKVLITNLRNSEQEGDLTLPANCNGYGRIHHFRRYGDVRFPQNPLPIDPACHALGLGFPDLLKVQVFQNAICSWRCWYCYVDYKLLSGNTSYAGWKSADELLELYLKEPDRPAVIDLSGGQPDLVPEWILWFTDSIKMRGLDNSVYVWSDDNLSNDFLWRYLKTSELQRLVSFKNYGRVGCFKGFDADSFSFNTKADPSKFEDQFLLMKRLVDFGFDVYGYGTFTTTSEKNIHHKMSSFIDKLQEKVHPKFPLRLIPLEIQQFAPMKGRVNDFHSRALALQYDAVRAWSEELAKRFSQEEKELRIFEISLK